jgi:hypothetical protein
MGHNVFALIRDRTVIISKSNGTVRGPQHVILATNSIVLPTALIGGTDPPRMVPRLKVPASRAELEI